MLDEYKWKAMNLLKQSLESTGVISHTYKGVIIGYLQMAVGEAYHEGVREGEKKANERRDEGEQR